MTIKGLPVKYKKIWGKALPLLRNGRPGDDAHAKETVKFILNYKGKFKFDKDILIPTAMMHDIGHAAILPEHFKYVTGPEKVKNGKLAHMLAGAKIAHDILASAGYDRKISEEIVEIIRIHDYDQLEGVDLKAAYNTKNKKLFHDIDSLDRYTEVRIKNMSLLYKDKEELLRILENLIKSFFYPDMKKIAESEIRKLKTKYL